MLLAGTEGSQLATELLPSAGSELHHERLLAGEIQGLSKTSLTHSANTAAESRRSGNPEHRRPSGIGIDAHDGAADRRSCTLRR